MKKMLKKAFTLVELLVVIAILAVLATVSVVGYSSFTKKANASADQQAVTQMNNVLQANEINSGSTINDLYDVFSESGLSVKDYSPLSKNTYFFWDKDLNRIVYTDADYNVMYPESLKDANRNDHQWYSLTQEIPTVDINKEKVNGQPVKNITEAGDKKTYEFIAENEEQLYSIGQELKDAMLKGTSSEYDVVKNSVSNFINGDVVVTLTKDIDFMGGAFNFSIYGNFTLNGNGHTISGIVNNKDFITSTSNDKSTAEKYGSGIVGYLYSESTTNKAHASFNDVTIKDCVFGASDTKGSAALVGYANYADIIINKVTVEDCKMTAFGHSVGGFIGDTQNFVSINVEGQNTLSNCFLHVVEEKGKTPAANEAYGIGLFIGRQVYANLNVSVASGATFTATNNSKLYGEGSTEIIPSGNPWDNYKSWDNITGASN